MATAKPCKKIVVHIRNLAIPAFSLELATKYAEKLYNSIGIKFEIGSSISLALKKTEMATLSVVDGACKWDQNNSEQDMLYKLAGLTRKNGIVVFIVKGIKTASGTLNGCAGHSLDKPAIVVGANASKFTIAHEIGHLLLGSDHSPVHEKSKSNIMYGGGTINIPSNSFPQFNSSQIIEIFKSPYLKNC